MSQFRFIPFTPHLLLSSYIEKIYVFESNGRLPAEERKLIVPNANLKLTLTYRNGIVANIGDKTFSQAENELSLTGLVDQPVSLDVLEEARTGTIIIEFNPRGAYRFFHLLFSDVKNQIVELPELLGNAAIEVQSRLAEVNSITLKLQLLQNFLIKQLETSIADPIYDYCINRILDKAGLLTINQLAKETGYSSRWLHTKFTERLGTGPKNFSEIIRFKQFYQAFSTSDDYQSLKHQVYHHYHDQSHFIRAFKRFTGSTPTDLQNSMNELATKHYTSGLPIRTIQ